MDAYQRWNHALATRFFNTDMEGRQVYLYVNQDLIEEMEQDMPEAGPFRVAVAGLSPTNSPFWRNYRRRVCRRALEAFRNWRGRRSN